MVHQFAVRLVDLAAFRLFDAEGLDSGDGDDGSAVVVGALAVEGVGDAHDPDILAEGVSERAAVRVCPVLQRGERLIPDRLRRYQPKHRRRICEKEAVTGDAHRMRGENSLATSSGDAQADVRQARKLGGVVVRAIGEVNERGRSLAELHGLFEEPVK